MALRRNAASFFPGLTLLPFLDIIFSMIGIFIVVFALQKIISSEAGRLPQVDFIVVCAEDRMVNLYTQAETAPRPFSRLQFPELFTFLSQQQGVKNLVFAFTRDCFNTQAIFDREFNRFTALLGSQSVADTTVFRLSFRPLSTRPTAIAELLAIWRGARATDE